jgi:hypothetical protein
MHRMLPIVAQQRREAVHMLTRVALLAASLAASAALAVGLALAGYAPAASVAPAARPAAPIAGAPAPITQIDTVYVAPQATPQQITVEKVVTAHHSGDDDNESGGG